MLSNKMSMYSRRRRAKASHDELGALIVDEDPHVKAFEDVRLGIQNMYIEETYGFGILNEGQAIAVAKNIKIRPNEFTLPARSVHAANNPHAPTAKADNAGACGTFPGSRRSIWRSDQVSPSPPNKNLLPRAPGPTPRPFDSRV
jgi:hypothetical protein